jgi:hypothetical protein
MRTLLILGLAVSFAGSASAFTMIDFDAFAAGTPIGNNFGGYGVDFWNDTTNTLTVAAQYPGPPFSSPNSAFDSNGYSNSHNFAKFIGMPANYVEVCMGDYDADAEDIFLEAYDDSNNLVASDSDFLPADLNGGKVVSVSAASIRWVKFYSTGSYPGSVFFDNFGFEPVPEPTTVSLVGFGLLGLAGLLKRRF